MTLARKIQIAIGTILVLIIAICATYVTGRSHGRADNQPATEAAETAQSACSADLEARNAELSTAVKRGLMLEARRRVARAGDEMDARNFGMAERELRAAAHSLERAVEGHPEVDDLKTRLNDANVSVAADLDQQRAAIRGFAAEMDALLTPAR